MEKDNRRSRQEMQKNRMIFLIILVAAVAVLLILVLLLGRNQKFNMSFGRRQPVTADDGENDQPADGTYSIGDPEDAENGSGSAAGDPADDAAATSDDSSTGLITYNGKKYRYNDHLSNYLLLGIDQSGDIDAEYRPVTAGQSDFLMLVVYDRKEETAEVISIPRETMTEIIIYNGKGTEIGPWNAQITLQYAYGKGGRDSCELTRNAVSKLLFEMPVNGYAAINVDAIGKLVDAIGGVEVTLKDDALAEVNADWVAGATVSVTGENAERFVRYRDIDVAYSSMGRLDRQINLINVMTEKMLAMQKEDPHTITDLYETMKPQMVTNMTHDVFLDVATAKRTGAIRVLPGEITHGAQNHDEYHVDDKALYELILDVFYTEQE